MVNFNGADESDSESQGEYETEQQSDDESATDSDSQSGSLIETILDLLFALTPRIGLDALLPKSALLIRLSVKRRPYPPRPSLRPPPLHWPRRFLAVVIVGIVAASPSLLSRPRCLCCFQSLHPYFSLPKSTIGYRSSQALLPPPDGRASPAKLSFLEEKQPSHKW